MPRPTPSSLRKDASVPDRLPPHGGRFLSIYVAPIAAPVESAVHAVITR